jgi:CBS domain-containing protein
MEDQMKVQDIMSTSVHSIRPSDSIAEAAQSMSEHDVGILPVVEGQKLVGILSDRDIAVRAVARSAAPESLVRQIMTEKVASCYPEDSIEDALKTMSDEQIRRLPVCNAEGEMVGIVTLADAAQRDPDKREVGEALEEISEPSRRHCQTFIPA